MSTYVDIHILQSVPPSCINRDDSGSPKSAVYGGVRRARVSSQAWKRAARTEFNSHLDTAELGERTFEAVARVAAVVATRAPELADQSEQLAAEVIKKAGIKLSKPKKEGQEDAPERTGYLLFLARAQISALADLAIEAGRGEKITAKRAKEAFGTGNSIDLALFGRMVADAPDLNVDACCQVMHALSVHAATPEFDYFTAVDDNAPEDNAGAGMIGTVEFVSATLYRYATINAGELAESLGSAEAAVRAIAAFLRAFAVSMPTGKQNTFANRTRPDFVAVQVREDQPVNLIGAFEDAIDVTAGRMATAATRLGEYAADLDGAYGVGPVAAAHLGVGGVTAAEDALAAFGERGTLDDVVRAAEDAVRERIVDK